MKAKTIKALDALIAALEELKEALESEANKSGGSADEPAAGKVSGSKGKTKAGGVPAAGKKSRAVPDDDGDVDEPDADADDTDADDDDDDLPPPKAAKGKTAAPVKGKAAKEEPPVKGKAAAKGKKATDETDGDLDAVKENLTAVMNHASLGKERVVKILKKYGATRSAELGEDDYGAVIAACKKALAEVADSDDGDDDDDL